MAEAGPGDLTSMLRRGRRTAGLTREALAERADPRARGTQDLELGVVQPLRETVARRPRAVAPGDPGPALPAPLTSFVGREADLAELGRLLPTARLLTLTGAGGAGKTRLALELAGRVAADGGEVRLVELAALDRPALVPQVVAAAIGAREAPGRPLLGALLAALRGRPALLLLDNCEHLLDACARLAEALLRGCPELRLLTTSREPLGVTGELTWPVPPLPLPPAGAETPADLAASDAVRLFVERARAARPCFALDEHNAAAVARVCRRLDGLPLAIELAAARARALPPAQLAARLDDRFRLLVGGSPAAPPHQRTLRATLDWSHDLLSAPERALFRRLAVFPGAFPLEAAEAVGAGDGIEVAEVAALVARLVDRSLLAAGERAGQARYRLLETVRAYAIERLAAAGEVDAAHGRLRDWALALTERQEGGPFRDDHTAWQEGLAAEGDTFREVLDWCERRDPEAGMRLAWRLRISWRIRGHPLAEQRCIERLSAALPPGSTLRARGLLAAAELSLYYGGDPAAMERLVREALALARAQGDEAATGYALIDLARLTWRRGDGRAQALFEEALARFQLLGHFGVSMARLWLANWHEGHGEWEAARALREAELAEGRRQGDPLRLGQALSCLGELAERTGDERAALTLHAEALPLCRAAGQRWQELTSLRRLAELEARAGAGARATALAVEALAVARRIGSAATLGSALDTLTTVAAAAGDQAVVDAQLAEVVAACRAADDRWGEAEALAAVGMARRHAAQLAAARPPLEEALASFRALGAADRVAEILAYLGDVRRRQGERSACRAALEEALAAARALGVPPLRYVPLDALGRAELEAGDPDAGRARYAEALALARERGDRFPATYLLAGAAQSALQAGRPRDAARLLAVAHALRRAVGVPWTPLDRQDHAPTLAAARAALGEGAFSAAWAAARVLTAEEASAAAWAAGEALRDEEAAGHAGPAHPAASPAPRVAPTSPGGLSPREAEVLRLIAGGRSNREIADSLVISVRTVERHITNLYTKIGASGKADATAYAYRHGLL